MGKVLSRILKDKEKIKETIEELGRYKRDALQTTWEKLTVIWWYICGTVTGKPWEAIAT